ncbi:MAG TPA: hypothetical protein VGK00_15220 [Anaerolineales bacterium]|jgi:hypothetical protein
MKGMSLIEISKMNETGESQAWSNFYQTAPEKFKKQYGIQTRQVGSLSITMIPGIDMAFFNRISLIGILEEASENMLDDAIAVLEKAGLTNYIVQVSPVAQPAAIPDWLTARGFVRTDNWAKVYRDNRSISLIETDLRVEIITRKKADAFADVAIKAFEVSDAFHPFFSGPIEQPGWVHFVAFEGQEPAAAGALYVKGEIGWLGFGATKPEFRKRGGQGAIMTRRIAEGIKMGCKWLITETGEETAEEPNPSYHNMLRSGFQLAYQRPNYVHKAG